MTPTVADRILALVPGAIERQRAALEAVDGLSQVQVIVHLDRYGPGRDKVDVRFEAGQPKRFTVEETT